MKSTKLCVLKTLALDFLNKLWEEDLVDSLTYSNTYELVEKAKRRDEIYSRMADMLRLTWFHNKEEGEL